MTALRIALLGLAALVVTTLFPAAASSAAPAFYDPPARLPATNGAIVRTEAMKLGASVAFPGADGPIPGRATRLMYKSTDSNGRPVAVTGTYIEPLRAWKGGGPRPLVTLAEGTQGQGDQCAPSRTLERPIRVSVDGLSLGYEIPSIYGLLSRGVAVVVTDYVGLGTTDRLHTYVNRLDQGHAVLDAARAARRVKGASVTAKSRVAAYGYSQGGGAAAAAAELQPRYARELKLAGAYAGAPPADLAAVVKGIDGTVLTGAIGYAVNGFRQSNPELGPILQANVNRLGRAALERVSTQCLADTALTFPFARTSSWTKSGKPLSDVIAANPPARKVIDDQRIGRSKPTAPVRVVTGTKDDLVPHGQARRLAADWCALGARVTYVPVVQPLASGGTAINHLAPYVSDNLAAQRWIVDRLSGAGAGGNCGRLATMP